MATSPLESRAEKVLYEFDAFRIDPVRRRLLRAGEPVPLTPKAFSILMVLLENRGGVVEKEALIRRVWPDAYVTEANLTQNISSLRKALGERANDHRYVVTVPGLGYSFVAEVLEVPRESSGEIQVVAAAPAPFVPVAVPADPPAGDHPAPSGESEVARFPAAAEPQRGRRWFLAAGLTLGFLIAVAGIGLVVLNRKPRPGPALPAGFPPGAKRPAVIRPAMAVLSLRNLSGEPDESWLSIALSEMLTTELSAGSRVRMVSGEEIARARETLSLSHTEELSAENLRQIHDLLGTDLVVVGSYLALGEAADSKIRIDLRVLKAPGGDTVGSVAQVGTEENLFDLVSLAGRRLRRSLGWTDPSPEETRAARALLPADSDAARLYIEGLTRLRAADSRDARERLEQAAELDPNSAVIRSALSLAWNGLGDDAQAREEARKAVELAAALPKEERLATEARFAEAKKDWLKASELYRSLWTFYPDNLEYGLRLANSLSIAGRNGEARSTVDSLGMLPLPWREDPRIDLVAAQIARRLGDATEELRAASVAAAKGSKLGQTQVLGEALLLQGDALYTMGRPEESIARFHRAQPLFAKGGNNAALARALNRIGAALFYTGDYPGAERNFKQALATAQQLGSKELIATQTMALAFVAANQGELGRARSLAEQAYASFMELGEHLYETRTLFEIAEILWESGDTQQARRHYDEVLDRARKSSNRVEEGRALDGIARDLVAAGELREARSRQEQAVRIARASGDPLLAASYQAALGQTLVLQGDLTAAGRNLQAALEAKRRVRDRLGISQVLGLLSGLAYEQGDLSRARSYADEQRTLADQIQAKLASAAALQRQARLDVAAGDLATAHKRLSEALLLSRSRGADLLATETRLEMAKLALLERQPAEAGRLAGEVADWYGRRSMDRCRARALAVQSQALLASGQAARAEDVAQQAHSISETSEDRELQILVVTAIAPAGVASGELRSSLGHLRWAVGEANRLGYVAAGLEARLLLGALQMRTGDPIAGRTALDELRRDAEARGFKEIAKRAAAFQTGQPAPLG